MERLVLHEYAASGNCYKIRLTAALLGLKIERREYDHLWMPLPQLRHHIELIGKE